MKDDWSVYILQCADNTLYTGITNDVSKRIDTHNQGLGAKYTRGRLPVTLLYKTGDMTRGEALKTEAAFKKMSRKNKLELINLGRQK